MPRTIHIRDIDDDAYDTLVRRAVELGLSVSVLLRKETRRLAARTTIDEWLERTRRRPSARAQRDTIEALDEMRGAWPS